MARRTPQQSAFNGGELSPLMEGRSDVKRYTSGVSRLENHHIMVAGPVRRRSGTELVRIAISSTAADKSRLHPFVYTTDTAYIIEIGVDRWRFFEDNRHLGSGSDIVSGLPYLQSELEELAFTQSANVLYISHPKHQPAKLTRTSPTTFSFDPYDTEDGPYLDTNKTAITMSLTAPILGPGSTLFTASGSGFGHDGNGFHVDDAATGTYGGRLIRWKYEGSELWGWGRIKTRLTATTVHVVIEALPSGAKSPSLTWRLGAWGLQEDLGWPTTVAFFQDRLVYAATVHQPETVWGSVSGAYDEHSPTNEVPDAVGPISSVAADSAYSFTQSAGYTGQVNTLRWLAPTSELVLGADGGVSTMSSDQTGPVTPFNVFIRDSNSYGCAWVQPVRVEDFVVYVSKTRRKLRGLGYSFNDQTWVSEDLTSITEEILRGGVRQLAYQREPHGVIWMVRADGVLVSLTLERTQKVAGFARHIVGGTSLVETFTDADCQVDGVPAVAGDSEITMTAHGLTNNQGPVRLYSTGSLPTGLREQLNYFVRVVDANTIMLSKKKGGRPVRVTALVDELATHRLEVPAKIESVAVIPATASDSDHDQVWVSVLREIDGDSVRSIELLRPDFEVDGALDDAWFVDMGWERAATGSPVTTVQPMEPDSVPSDAATELPFLSNEYVVVFADGAFQAIRQADSSGNVVVEPPGDHVLVGYLFESNCYGMNFETEDQEGATRGKKRRMIQLTVQYDSTVGAEVGPDPERLRAVDWRDSSDVMDAPPTLFSGLKRSATQDEWGEEGRVHVRQRLPYPQTLVAWVPWYKGGDR